jgi:4-amino-4-deoxy-L-arabinose transferase-like glycosyltransferase
MEESNNETEDNKLKSFFKENLPIILILLIGFAIRLYYFILTKNQAEWYDAGEYLSYAAHWAFGLPIEALNPQRPPLFPLIEALFLKLGFDDNLLKFFIELIPSTLVILISYLIVKEMYNKKLALLTSFLMSIFWLVIFNTVRLHADIPLLFFSYLSVYYFWKGYIKKGKNYYLYLAFIFIALAFLIKLIAALFLIVFLIFLLFIDKLKFLKNKHLWLAFILFILILVPYFIWQNNVFGKPTAFLFASHVTYDPGGITSYKPIGWHVLNFIPWMLNTPYFILLLIGLITLYTLFLSLDLIIKNKSNEKHNDLFIFLWILITLVYFVFLERDAEDRWLLPIALPLLILVSKGLYFVYDMIKKYEKNIAVTIFIALILLGGYFQLERADETINAKKDSYIQVKEASLWIKENSNKDDIIFSKSVTQMTYYAQRQVIGPDGNETEFKSKVKEFKPKYLVLSIFEVHSQDLLSYPDKFKDSLEPVKTYFLDKEQKQLVLVIYKFKNYNL